MTTSLQDLVAETRFELVTFGLWAQRATRLLYSAINKWWRWRDSNPRTTFAVSRFSRPTPSTRLGYISIYNWWSVLDLNQRPTGYEPVALTNWANGPYLVAEEGLEPPTHWIWTNCSNQLSYSANNMVERTRLELATPCVQGMCSTNWAITP